MQLIRRDFSTIIKTEVDKKRDRKREREREGGSVKDIEKGPAGFNSSRALIEGEIE